MSLNLVRYFLCQTTQSIKLKALWEPVPSNCLCGVVGWVWDCALPGVWWVKVLGSNPERFILWSKYKSKSAMTTGYVRNFSTFYHDIYYLTGQKIQPLYYAIIALCAFLFIYLFIFYFLFQLREWWCLWSFALIFFSPNFKVATESQAGGIVMTGSKVTGIAETGSKTRSGILRNFGLWSFSTFYYGITFQDRKYRNLCVWFNI